MQHVDTILRARWVIPVEPTNTILEHHSVIIDKGCITAIESNDIAEQSYQSDDVIDLGQHALIPGLINTHTHVAMNLFRGIADDLPLMTWLNEHIWPAEQKWVDRAFVYDGSLLAMAEMLRGGITCFNDMYFFPDATAEAAIDAGMRCTIGLIALDFPTVWAKNAHEYLSKGFSVHDQFKNDPLISTAFAPHAPYTVSDEPLQKIQTYADELDIPIHMHIHETADEVQQAVDANAKRPLQRLQELGLLTPKLLAVHMTQLNDDEIMLCAKQGVNVIHCPESNLKLASGFCPAAKLLDAGANLALGTDGAASNNDLNMLGEMRTAALLAKGVAQDASAMPAAQVLYCATMGGAKAMGREQEIGSLSVGKLADITAIDLSAIETQPIFDPISHIVYCADRNQVSDVWVGGKRLLKQGQLTTIDTESVLAKAKTWQQAISTKG